MFQGQISTLFTNDLRNYFKWIGSGGSDCGLANCNISKGAETGCAFEGEKEIGGHGFNGSDLWMQYTRMCSFMMNYSLISKHAKLKAWFYNSKLFCSIVLSNKLY